MTRRCVAGYCSNTNKDGVSLFSFPKDSELRKIWNNFVKRNREDWVEASKSSVLCSAHFSPECFDAKPNLMASMGLKYKFKNVLKPGAVPTISTTQHPTFRNLRAKNGSQKEDGSHKQIPETIKSLSQSMVVSTARKAMQTPFGSLASKESHSAMNKRGRKRVIATLFSEVDTNKNSAVIANADDHIDLSIQHRPSLKVPSIGCQMVNRLFNHGEQYQMNYHTVLLARCGMVKRGESRASQLVCNTASDIDKFVERDRVMEVKGCTKERSSGNSGSVPYGSSDNILESQDFKSDHTYAARPKVYHLRHEWLYSKTKEKETLIDNVYSLDVSLHVDVRNNKDFKSEEAHFMMEKEDAIALGENSLLVQEDDVCLKKENDFYIKDEEDIFIKEEDIGDMFSDVFLKEEQDSFVSKRESIYANSVMFPIDSV